LPHVICFTILLDTKRFSVWTPKSKCMALTTTRPGEPSWSASSVLVTQIMHCLSTGCRQQIGDEAWTWRPTEAHPCTHRTPLPRSAPPRGCGAAKNCRCVIYITEAMAWPG